MPADKIHIQPHSHQEFDECLAYAKKNGHGIEVTSFASSDVLDSDWKSMLVDHQSALRGFKGGISMHGPYKDLYIHSPDSKVRAVAEERIRQSLDIATALKASQVVFHGNFNALIRSPAYQRDWVERNAEFWSGILADYKVTVLLENLWEPTPAIFRALLDRVASPRLKVCFDTGHARVFSPVPFSDWFSVLGKDIAYLHINDNKGDKDSELVPGKGDIDWSAFSALVDAHCAKPITVFEVGTLSDARAAMAFFEARQFYPFG